MVLLFVVGIRMHSEISNINRKAHFGVEKNVVLIEIIGNVSSKMTCTDMDLSACHAETL